MKHMATIIRQKSRLDVSTRFRPGKPMAADITLHYHEFRLWQPQNTLATLALMKSNDR